ncbi:hypothetical protein C0991_005203 [Blastosporella zonata]|nr:hypothetical protein C0991_005203 [Blastosporella zonata]
MKSFAILSLFVALAVAAPLVKEVTVDDGIKLYERGVKAVTAQVDDGIKLYERGVKVATGKSDSLHQIQVLK